MHTPSVRRENYLLWFNCELYQMQIELESGLINVIHWVEANCYGVTNWRFNQWHPPFDKCYALTHFACMRCVCNVDVWTGVENYFELKSMPKSRFHWFRMLCTPSWHAIHSVVCYRMVSSWCNSNYDENIIYHFMFTSLDLEFEIDASKWMRYWS